MRKIITTIALSLIIIGCTSQRKIMDSWMGQPTSRLIMSWGPPARTTSDGNGGEVLIYAHEVYAPQMNWHYWDYKMMYAHADGKIYWWRTSRERIPPTEVVVTFR